MSAYDPKRALTSLRMVTVRRRDFIKVIAGSAAAWPFIARAQQPTMPVIGFLGSSSADASRIAAFRQGLAQVGYVKGRNVAVEYRWAENRSDRLPAMVSDLVHRQSGRNCRDYHSGGARGKGGEHYDSHCLHHHRRFGAARPRHQP
jgi:hypothetical protein